MIDPKWLELPPAEYLAARIEHILQGHCGSKAPLMFWPPGPSVEAATTREYTKALFLRQYWQAKAEEACK